MKQEIYIWKHTRDLLSNLRKNNNADRKNSGPFYIVNTNPTFIANKLSNIHKVEKIPEKVLTETYLRDIIIKLSDTERKRETVEQVSWKLNNAQYKTLEDSESKSRNYLRSQAEDEIKSAS